MFQKMHYYKKKQAYIKIMNKRLEFDCLIRNGLEKMEESYDRLEKESLACERKWKISHGR